MFRWIDIRTEDQSKLGTFSFMSLIDESGKISFFYKKVPEIPLFVVDEFHPVTIGLADAHRQKVNLT